ncbi:MAG: prepilin-type N-terminal cleavage/methylation domain-containing protein [Cyanobacteria bacterium P01_G01_bin.54]
MRWLPRPQTQPDSGFTLIEVIIVVVIIGILAAIAAPSWLGFMRQRRVNAVNDAIYQAIEQAKNRAQTEKMSYSVGFRSVEGLPQIAVYPASLNVPADGGTTLNDEERAAMNSAWEANKLDSGVNLRSYEVIMATNLVGENDIEDTGYDFANSGKKLTTIPDTIAPNDDQTLIDQLPIHRITFDLTGTISNTPDLSTATYTPESGAVMVAGVPDDANDLNAVAADTEPVLGTVRCVLTGTLIGGLKVGRNPSDCSKLVAGE